MGVACEWCAYLVFVQGSRAAGNGVVTEGTALLIITQVSSGL